MNTSELTGAKLDYWVAKAEGYDFIDIPADADGNNASRILAPPGLLASGWVPGPRGRYGNMLKKWSTDWAEAGSIIERVGMLIRPHSWHGDKITLWAAFCYDWSKGENYGQTGETPLIAAMRSYVRSKFGPEVPDVEG